MEMLRDIAQLIVSTLGGLFTLALLLRAYLFWLHMPRSNQLSHFCVALTDWLVGPVRRLLPPMGRIDWSCWAAALLIAAATQASFHLLAGYGSWQFFVPEVIALLVKRILDLVLVMVVVFALVSTINPHAPLAPTLDVLTRPLLAPIRRVLPPVGGFDLSPMVVVLVVLILIRVLEGIGL